MLEQQKWRENNRIMEISGIALTMTILFHFLPANHPFGFAFAIFSIFLAIGMILIATMTRKPINYWAFLFLIPVGLGALSHALYASEVTRALTFLLSIASLSFFAYWITRPKITYKEVQRFWPLPFFFETIWPFQSLKKHLASIEDDKRLKSVLLGAAVAIPFLLIFLTLFTSADQLFAKSFSSLFESQQIAEYAIKLFRDVLVGLYFLSAGYLMFDRMLKHAQDPEKNTHLPLNHTALITFFTLLNILFAIFVIFQAAYFFGGETFIAAQDLTYAEYARGGFFELLFAAGLVFVITWFVYRATDMTKRAAGLLNVALIVQTGIIIASAINRLLLYIDAYGLTLSRWWAAICIVLIGLTLFTCAIGTVIKIPYTRMAKTIFLMAMIFISLTLTLNSEVFIARYNIIRYLDGRTKTLDAAYLLTNLSEDALPIVTEFATVPWPTESLNWTVERWMEQEPHAMNREELQIKLREQQDALNETISSQWLGASISHFKALTALNRIN